MKYIVILINSWDYLRELIKSLKKVNFNISPSFTDSSCFIQFPTKVSINFETKYMSHLGQSKYFKAEKLSIDEIISKYVLYKLED